MSYRIYANNIDISASVEKNTVKINEQLNNRSNMCNFGILENNIDASTTIKVYEYFEITEQANSGQAVLKVDDTYDYYDVFVAGNEILLDFEWSLRQYVTILSVNHDTKEITLTTNLSVNIPAGTYGGRLVFAGTTERNPDDQLWYLNTFSYKVTAIDRKPTFDRKVVVETYQNQYMREIMGRIIYQFMANDDEVTLEDFEAAWTQGGVWLVMQDNSQDRIFWQRSQETGTNAAGTATWTKTLPSTVDISTMSDVRLWHKVIEDEGSKVDSLIYRVGSDSSNYLERSSIWVGVDSEDCWNYENFKIDRATIVWSPDLTNIDRLQIELQANAAIPQWSIRFDLSQATLGGFTLKNVFRGDTPFVDFRKQYEKPSSVIEDICKLQGIFWFIDYDRDLHVFRQNADPAPFGLDNSSLNRGDMSLSVDISMLRNRQTVRGWEAPSINRLVQDQRTDWVKETWELSYKPKDLEIYVAYQDIAITSATWLANVATFTTAVNHGYSIGDKVAVTDMDPNQYSGSYIITDVPTLNTFEVDLVTATPPGVFIAWGFVGEFQQKTVWVENLVDPWTVDYVFNFQEKVIRRGSDDILPDGAVIRADYFPYQAIRVRVKNQPSIDALKLIAGGDGIFDGDVIEDASILTFEEARRRAQAEVNAYGNPIINIKFQTNKAWLHAGQVIRIIDINRGINDDYLIQKVSRKSKEGARSEYQVECASTMFGIIEFFQLLLKKSRRSVVDLSELVDIVVNQDETITITPTLQFFQKSNIVTAASTMAAKWWDFIETNGSRSNTGRILNPNRRINNMWQCTITAATTATVWFDAASDYNTSKALFVNIVSYTGPATGKYAQASLLQRLPVNPSVDYKFSAWIQNLISIGLVGWLGLTVELVEYANKNGWSPLAVTMLVAGLTDYHDYKYYTDTITTQAGTGYIDIVVRVDESTGEIGVGDILLEELATESQANPGISSFSEAT